MIDLHAMALTIPYCDLVMADKAMCDHALRCSLPERYRTTILTRLSDLEDYL